MTKRSRWDEQKLEEQLQQLPPIKDRQSKETLFQAIEKKMNDRKIDQTEPVVVKKRSAWFFPTIASAAAVFLLLLIVPSLLNNNQFSNDDMSMESVEMDRSTDSGEIGILMESQDDSDEAAAEEEEMEMGIASAPDEEVMDSEGAVVEAPFTVVPVPYSMQVPVMLDSGLGMDGRVTLVGKTVEITSEIEMDLESLIYLALTSEEAYFGVDLSDQLQGVEFNEKENSVTIDFTDNHRMESLSSNESNIFSRSIHEFFSFLNIETVKFSVNGKSGIMYAQSGERYHEWGINTDNRGYYLYEAEDGTNLLVRATATEEAMRENGELMTFEATLEKMKKVTDNAWYKSVIPEGVTFSNMVIDGTRVMISLSDDSDLTLEEFDLLYEAVALTASDFSLDIISFDGGPMDEISKYRETDGISTVNLVPNTGLR